MTMVREARLVKFQLNTGTKGFLHADSLTGPLSRKALSELKR